MFSRISFMTSVTKITQAISIFLSNLISRVITYLTAHKSSNEDNDHDEEKRLEDFQLPLDIVVEILIKIPSKSLVRFRCVSKQWSTIISNRRDFIESIMTRSLIQPPHQLPLFIFHRCVPGTFFSVSLTFSQSNKLAVSIVSGSSNFYPYQCQYVRGLICCSSSVSRLVTIYNPTTRQCVHLAGIKSLVQSQRSYCYFGYDPVINQYKILSMTIDLQELTQTFRVFTLGSPIRRQHWRKIQSNIDEKLFPSLQGVCIDGTIYYGATRMIKLGNHGETVLLSFDIRSERFDHLRAPETLLEALSTPTCVKTLVNHLGKLGCICCNREDTSLWIMENSEKQEWSKITFWLPENPLMLLGGDFYSFSGITPAGEIFLLQRTYYFDNKPSYVYYYDMKQNSFRRVEIQGTCPEKIRNRRFYINVAAVHDHVENTMWL